MPVVYGSLPFDEALQFMRDKLNLPTKKWDDLLGAAHDRAFVVAGAMQADLLADLKAAVETAIAEGTTLDTFRNDFEKIVAERGWTGWTGEGTKAGRAWRARIIYDTNLFTSYSAGRVQQMKDVAKARPYWRYRHSDASVVPRPEHLAWDGVIRRHDDGWWSQHAPPNGWNCFPAGTEVATPRGWQPIETLRRGDQVIGGSGNIQTVQVPQIRPFEGEIVWVATEQGEVAATPNHRFLTLRGWIRAENLKVGEMLVQIPQVARLNGSIGDIKHFYPASAQLSVARPFHGFQASASKTFDPHIERGQENIHPVGEKTVIINCLNPPFRQGSQQQPLAMSWLGAGIDMSGWISLVQSSLRFPHLGAHFRAERGRRSFQPFRASARSFIGFLSFSKSVMAAFRCLLNSDFAQNFRSLLPTGIVIDPLNANSLLAVAGGDTKPFHHPHHRSVIAAPSLAKAGDRQSLFAIQDPEGFVSGAPLDQFNSLEDFCGWAGAHGAISSVVAIRQQSYTGSVYNLSITEDASYCLRLGVVHNCKCYIETLSEREMKKAGLKITPEDEIPYNGKVKGVDPKTGEEFTRPEGIDRGWDYQPGANATTPLADLLASKAAQWSTDLKATVAAFLKNVLSEEVWAAVEKALAGIGPNKTRTGGA